MNLQADLKVGSNVNLFYLHITESVDIARSTQKHPAVNCNVRQLMLGMCQGNSFRRFLGCLGLLRVLF